MYKFKFSWAEPSRVGRQCKEGLSGASKTSGFSARRPKSSAGIYGSGCPASLSVQPHGQTDLPDEVPTNLMDESTLIPKIQTVCDFKIRKSIKFYFIVVKFKKKIM